ncbi:Transferase domain-containing protein [Cephalotus follicularis]|uniref:Transferase domain-containing protein n=1 Tax=Cephalotus follicularis TaxID=3775 RepID=A0A1Q3BKM0_CEPFO|nr:Transferase domain-containing protein [Cephalotus follicularis]
MPSSSLNITIISKTRIYPAQKSTMKTLKLSVSDLPMLSCQYIQKGVLLPSSPYSSHQLISFLKHSLSLTLSHFPPLAGRLLTDSHCYVSIVCNDAGIDFIHANAKHLSITNILSPRHDVPDCFKHFFTLDRTLSYSGHFKPLVAVQVTELADAVFVGCTVNHAVTDGTSFWHFFNTFAEICKGGGGNKVSKSPDFCRNNVFNSGEVLKFPPGGPKATFSGDEPLRERILHFSREAILKLKQKANSGRLLPKPIDNGIPVFAEILGKQCNDCYNAVNGKTINSWKKDNEISSFQSLCAHLWRSVTRARNLEGDKTTTFRMAVNCRHRLEPRLEPYYFGNAIQSIPTVASVKEVLSRDLSWSADLLHKNVVAHGDETVRRGIADWVKEPRLFPLGNFDGASITMGSSPRFPMYDNDFGWGRPVAVRSGRANKFDGKISAFPGREGNGSIDLEVVLAPETMAGLENDHEFMQYVSTAVEKTFCQPL